MRAARERTCKMPKPEIRTRSPFLRCLVIKLTRFAEDGLPRALGELMILGQPCRQMLERNGACLGSSRWCFRFACARNRHDGLPSSEARKCAAVRDMIRALKESGVSAATRQNECSSPGRGSSEREVFRACAASRDIMESIRERSGIATGTWFSSAAAFRIERLRPPRPAARWLRSRITVRVDPLSAGHRTVRPGTVRRSPVPRSAARAGCRDRPGRC